MYPVACHSIALLGFLPSPRICAAPFSEPCVNIVRLRDRAAGRGGGPILHRGGTLQELLGPGERPMPRLLITHHFCSQLTLAKPDQRRLTAAACGPINRFPIIWRDTNSPPTIRRLHGIAESYELLLRPSADTLETEPIGRQACTAQAAGDPRLLSLSRVRPWGRGWCCRGCSRACCARGTSPAWGHRMR